MRQHGMTTRTYQRLSSRQAGYDVTMLGFNYRMDELRAALGLVQLQRLAEWNAKRKALTRHYLELLHERCPGVLVPFRKLQDTSSSNHIMPTILPRNAISADRSGPIARSAAFRPRFIILPPMRFRSIAKITPRPPYL